MSRPSRCMAPPLAQKSFCTSTSTSAACWGVTFSFNVFSMWFSSGFPDHRFDIERLGEFLPHRDVEVGFEARNVELGGEFGQVQRRHDLRLGAGIFRHEIVALRFAGL